MKCYNSFGEMFNAQSGGDRSVFNGIAQTKIEWEDPATGTDKHVFVRLSTNVPSKDIVSHWSDDGGVTYQKVSAAPKDVRRAVSKSGLPEIETELRDQIAKEIAKNPKFNSSAISDDLLIQTLNTLSQWKGKKLTWTDKGGTAVEGKKAPDSKSKSKPDPAPKNSYDPNKTYIKATGIVSDGKDGKNKHLIKVGMDKGKPFIEEFDASGSKVNCSIKAEDVLGIHFMDSIKNTPEAFANIDETRFAQALVARNNYGGSGFSSVYWRGGDVDANTLVHEYQNNNTLQHALNPNDPSNSNKKGGILKRLVRGTKQMLW